MSVILIIEDNPRNMKLVRDVLQVKGHSTLEATTAEDGIEIAKQELPDLVLMDIQLPGMNGIDALAHLRADTSLGTQASREVYDPAASCQTAHTRHPYRFLEFRPAAPTISIKDRPPNATMDQADITRKGTP